MAHVWLIGMMGTGKTTVGGLVAEELRRSFVDLDTEIMVTTGRTISDMFEEGESVFRVAEATALAAASLRDPSVIATGGGAVLARENLEIMRTTGVTVLLTASIDTIMDRIALGSERPLAVSRDAIAAIAGRRAAAYRDAADHTVATDGKDRHAVAEEVLACVAM